MNKFINKFFMPGVAEMVLDYCSPNYKANYDLVLRDLQWVAGRDAIQRLGHMLMDDERYDENWDEAVAMINVSSVEQYDDVMRQIAGGWGSDSRFY